MGVLVSTVHVSVTVDGHTYESDVEPRQLLVHHLRDGLGRVGTPIGCDTSSCGACTVLLDGKSVKSCSMLAVQADGRTITTLDRFTDDDLPLAHGEIGRLRAFFAEWCSELRRTGAAPEIADTAPISSVGALSFER